MTNLNEWLRRADKAIEAYNANCGVVHQSPGLAALVDEMRRWLGPSSKLEEEASDDTPLD